MPSSKTKRSAYLWVYVLAVIGLDQATKFLTVTFLPAMSRNAFWYPYGGVGIFKNVGGIEFSLVHATNKGAAWGAFSDYQELLLVARIAMVIALIVYTFFFNKQSKWQLPLALIIGGAVANIADFFLYGHVVDMFHFVLWGYDYPIFNVADSAICVGIAWIFLLSFSSDSKKKTKKKKSARR